MIFYVNEAVLGHSHFGAEFVTQHEGVKQF